MKKDNVPSALTSGFINEMKQIVLQARQKAYSAINAAMVEAYWQLGKRIVEQEQEGKERADYGKQLLKSISQELTKEFGKGFSVGSLYYYRQFYLTFPEIFATPWRILTWSHYKRIMQITNPDARMWYLREAAEQMWSYRTLVGRQQLVRTEKRDYFIDLVFYNYKLKCFVLIDLKTTAITHQDVGQMDMYIRMYDEKVRGKDDNPTIGIVLCSETDEDIARYSILHDNDQLFASKYMLYMPTPEELQLEIERQKAFFRLQQEQKQID